MVLLSLYGIRIYQPILTVHISSSENEIDCDFRRTGCCELTTYEAEVAEFEEYLQDKTPRMEKLKTKFELWGGSKCNERCFGQHWKAGLYQTLAGQFWPRKAVFGIAKLILSRGVHIRTKTFVTDVHRPSSSSSGSKSQHFLLQTDGGDVHCEHLIHATNGYASRLLPQLKGAIVPVRGQVLATSPIEGFFLPYNLGFNDGYEYLIHRKEDKRIIFGGMRWRAETVGQEVGVFDDSTIDPKVSDGLQGALPELFPMLKDEPNFKIDYEWTGIMGYSGDNWPLIGKISSNETKEWIAAGYSGNGMPQCFGAAKAVSEMITGKLPTGDDWIPQFNPLRFEDPVYAAKWIYTGRKQLKTEE
jgi:glycine/D-amino acid oxidase-like deaminating enzyme